MGELIYTSSSGLVGSRIQEQKASHFLYTRDQFIVGTASCQHGIEYTHVEPVCCNAVTALKAVVDDESTIGKQRYS
jgi:hypothetical protein